MGFQIYQREKSQAIDLLDRVASRLIDFNISAERSGDFDYDVQDAQNTVTRLTGEIEAKRTQLDVPQMSYADIMQLARNYEDNKRSWPSPVQFFATYLSNTAQADRDEIMLAAGYTLPEREQLLRECEHGVTLATDCCLECDCGIKAEVR
jgi:hypothetical protein